MIARALLFHHRGVRLTADQTARGMWITEAGDTLLREVLFAMGGERLSGDLGGGVLVYEALCGTTDLHVSTWRMQFLGGAIGVADDGERSGGLWAITGRPEIVESLTTLDR